MSDAPKHTPGPWEVQGKDGKVVIFAGKQSLGMVWPPLPGPLEPPGKLEMDQGVANAHLIAAAPSLLKALRGIVAANFSTVPPSEFQIAVRQLQDEARSAIAEAEEEG